MTKSVTSALVGIAVRDGSLALDDRVSRTSRRGAAPTRGRSPCATCSPTTAAASGRSTRTTSRWSRRPTAPAYAVGLDQQHPPGSDLGLQQRGDPGPRPRAREATGMRTADFAAKRLFGPLRMTHTQMTADTSGRSTNIFFGLQTTCLDLARFARLYLQPARSAASGSCRAPTSGVGRPARRPSSTRPTATCGGSTGTASSAAPPTRWTPPASRSRRTRASWSPAPRRTLFSAIGLGGQIAMVDPGIAHDRRPHRARPRRTRAAPTACATPTGPSPGRWQLTLPTTSRARRAGAAAGCPRR